MLEHHGIWEIWLQLGEMGKWAGMNVRVKASRTRPRIDEQLSDALLRLNPSKDATSGRGLCAPAAS